VRQLLRIGKRAIISFPNFAHWRIRWQILAWGRMPVTRTIGYRWYDTPNIHLCTIRDFAELAADVEASIERAIPLDRDGRPFRESLPIGVSNLVAPQALFVLTRAT
jgi:methionine biosynthesis protein MetW